MTLEQLQKLKEITEQLELANANLREDYAAVMNSLEQCIQICFNNVPPAVSMAIGNMYQAYKICLDDMSKSSNMNFENILVLWKMIIEQEMNNQMGIIKDHD